jgi:hypothetical protein
MSSKVLMVPSLVNVLLNALLARILDEISLGSGRRRRKMKSTFFHLENFKHSFLLDGNTG